MKTAILAQLAPDCIFSGLQQDISRYNGTKGKRNNSHGEARTLNLEITKIRKSLTR